MWYTIKIMMMLVFKLFQTNVYLCSPSYMQAHEHKIEKMLIRHRVAY